MGSDEGNEEPKAFLVVEQGPRDTNAHEGRRKSGRVWKTTKKKT
jgi:hypothetical protein